jgi:hypothetical protein
LVVVLVVLIMTVRMVLMAVLGAVVPTLVQRVLVVLALREILVVVLVTVMMVGTAAIGRGTSGVAAAALMQRVRPLLMVQRVVEALVNYSLTLWPMVQTQAMLLLLVATVATLAEAVGAVLMVLGQVVVLELVGVVQGATLDRIL